VFDGISWSIAEQHPVMVLGVENSLETAAFTVLL
jgi:hypothetical protein